MTKLFNRIEKQTQTLVYSIATLLDPRFNIVAFGIQENVNNTEKNIISEITYLLHTLNSGKYIMYV